MKRSVIDCVCFCFYIGCSEPLEKTFEQGYRFSAVTHEKHFENGVFEPCINANKKNGNNNISDSDENANDNRQNDGLNLFL